MGSHLLDVETGAESSSRTDSAGRKREAPLSAEGLPLFDPRLRGFGVVVVVVVVGVVVVGGVLYSKDRKIAFKVVSRN